MTRIFPKIRQIKNPQINLSYCKISILILYMVMLSLIICTFCMELKAISKIDISVNCSKLKTHELECKKAFKRYQIIDRITNLEPWITLSILFTQVYEW